MTFRERYPVAWEYHRNTERRRLGGALPAAVDVHADPPKEIPLAPYVALPAPDPVSMPFGEAVARRLSCRRFRTSPTAGAALSTLLWNAYAFGPSLPVGSIEFRERPVPSAGALYPLELYVVARHVEDVDPGVYHYASVTHGLELVRDVAVPGGLLTGLFMGQHYVEGAGAVLVITCEPERSLKKYGDRGYRYVLLEAGHVAQNVNLTAAALGLGAYNVGGFFDDELARLLMVDEDREVPLYAVAIGVPEEGDRTELRSPQ
ncbi:MAG TPA: SagB/ThcOx family dehydrogenase [Actinomycetota bacterium]|nr:SagB/ThcOx family dehydrogenase [Actinomycetota bacterium]